jgi:lysozyme
MNGNRLKDKIKKSEGFVGTVYKDHLGIDTIGIGTRMPLSETEAELILEHRLNDKINHILQEKPIVMTLSQERQEVIFEMCYQLGVGGVLKFKNMWTAIESNDFAQASVEMLDSKWHEQTPQRAEALAKEMGGIYA